MESNYRTSAQCNFGRNQFEQKIEEIPDVKNRQPALEEFLTFINDFIQHPCSGQAFNETVLGFSNIILDARKDEMDESYTCRLYFAGNDFTLRQAPGSSSIIISTNTKQPAEEVVNVTMDNLKETARHYISLSQHVEGLAIDDSVTEWTNEEFHLFEEFMQQIIKIDNKSERLAAMREAINSDQPIKNNPYLNKLVDLFLVFFGTANCNRLYMCFEHKDNTQLSNYMLSVLQNAGDLSNYPECSNTVLVLSSDVVAGPLAYTFFVDRVFSDADKFPRRSKLYGPDMFLDSDKQDCEGNYVSCCFTALDFLYSAPIAFSTSTDAEQLVGILKKTNEISRSRSDNLLNTTRDGARGGDGHIELFYACNDIDDSKIGNRSYAPMEVLNLKTGLSAGLFSQSENMTCLDSKYHSELEIIKFFSRHLTGYQNMLREALTDDEKMTAIIIFISVLEASHYFVDGNNRLFCQMLINKLLIENNLPQTILYIPNGFSRYVLGILPWPVRMGVVDLNAVPISVLRKRLEPALMMVREGQDFFRKVKDVADAAAQTQKLKNAADSAVQAQQGCTIS